MQNASEFMGMFLHLWNWGRKELLDLNYCAPTRPTQGAAVQELRCKKTQQLGSLPG